MATLVLQAAGQAVGGLLGPVGAIVGRAAGALAGNIIDQRLFGETTHRSVGRIDDVSVQTAAEGDPISRVYGRMRLAGTVIWATDFTEHGTTTSTGGKGGGSTVTEYSYTASFAVGLCEGTIARIGRVWADGEPLDLDQMAHRIHTGEADQAADPLIEGIEGDAPAYRHLAYVVFENLPIGPYGNRLPQLTFEVIRPVGALEEQVRAVTLIPGATEFGYHPDTVKRTLGPGEAVADNRHLTGASDIEASLDELQALCPNLERVALVVAWFGDDLRAGSCSLEPAVESRERETSIAWGVAGQTRATAKLVTDTGGDPNYGGTPSDNAVFEAVKAIRQRGLKVVFYPFLLMDVPAGNELPDPYGGEEQAAFPWRGRITVSPAPGEAGSPDGTSTADSMINAFVGSAVPGDFSASGAVVTYSGAAEWSLRRMVLHYAHLVDAAGGVDAFLVGSELRGLTTVRGASSYPFVDALSALVDDVRAVVGADTKISYAADWSEYFGHQPGSGDVSFHLDPLWANANVDFIGIDNYWPLADWRDGTHLDQSLASGPHDGAYLSANVRGGEGFDWYYASAADRLAQVRTPIADGAYGKDWVFRYKDLAAWWSNLHYDRVAGVEMGTPTAWLPGLKPVWFTEVGCPAVDRGANQPNVFYDPKSAESTLPYFSNGRRDDAMQRAYLGAMLGAFDPEKSTDIEAINPQSGVYSGRMVDPRTVHVWTWDARPWPAFPHRSDVWSDGENWERGHWLTGRLGTVPFEELVAALFADWGLEAPAVTAAPVVLDGYVVAGPKNLRSVLEPLLATTSIVGADTGTLIRFVGLSQESSATVDDDGLVEVTERRPLVSETRLEAAELPVEQRLRYFDSGREYQVASARYRPQEGSARQIEEIAVPASLNDGLATELAEIALAVRWTGRTTVRFALPLSRLAIVPGDVVSLMLDGRVRDLLVEEIEDFGHREVTARTIDRTAIVPTPTPGSPSPPVISPTYAAPIAVGLNLPIVDDSVAEHLPWLGVYARPWPGEMGVWRAVPGGAFQLVRTVTRAASLGEVVAAAPPGPTSRWDNAGHVDVRIYAATVSSAAEIDVLGGKNAIAARAASGLWEILQFATAELIGERTYRLTKLLRGQLGTEDANAEGLAVGAPIAVLDGSLATLPTPTDEVGLLRTYRVGPLAEGVGGGNVSTFEFTPTGRGLTPFSPVHGEARLEPGDGSLRIAWIRRTRKGGDAWPAGGTDVPLGESAELYQLEILNGGTVVRTVETMSPSYTYSLADQTADFGAAPDPISFRVAQIAPGFGAGVPYEVTVDVKQP
ncbi:baseplate multidomain protein megatron [Acuticoccus mangrovi]|uniref:Glycoside hydrolase/phage tail family protein n=1 Tax=Acuticoccus mangrovi TaxID=2796142 RepID=A0A934IJC3_9HYPH|nr:glycoside hydrolase/phage tail family protein [Acuticoccus mangrovi]MBJ3774812.1 glycoside hydrolase/phage tail family protein [Acuticoccus mangrovi]